MDNHVMLFTDGACIGNPGPGGWGFILEHLASGHQREGSGGEHNTTNNRMEITAVIRGLEALTCPCQVEVVSDSQYVVKAIMQWMAKWKFQGWRTGGDDVKNPDLWVRLDQLRQIHLVSATWVKGHSGHCENERCNTLAGAAAVKIAATPAPARAAVFDLFGRVA